MDDLNGTGNDQQPQVDGDPLIINPNADKGREPKLVSGRMGTRLYSMAALVEKVVSQFEQEHGTNSPALLASRTRSDKLRLLRDVVNYVLAVESVSAAPDEIVDLTRQAFAELFTYGPLDALFADPNVTTITLEGIDKTAVRYGHGELVRLPPIFEDDHQLRRVIGRLLKDAGAEIRPDTPYIETGLTVEGRPVSVNLVLPPATLYITADIRVHPTALPTLDSLVDSEQARTLLRAIAQSPHGFVVVGEAESGKTTLLSMLIALSGQQGIISVERAGELRLLDGAKQLKVQYAVGEPGQEGAQDAISFGGQIARALEESPGCIILDEVRSDEPEAILPLLMIEPPPRQCWAFRGQADSKRLSAALGMVARRGNPGNSEALVRALYARLPFIIAVRRRKERLQLHSISEWQYPPGAEYPDYMELMAQDWEGLALTGKRPARELALPDDFWG